MTNVLPSMVILPLRVNTRLPDIELEVVLIDSIRGLPNSTWAFAVPAPEHSEPLCNQSSESCNFPPLEVFQSVMKTLVLLLFSLFAIPLSATAQLPNQQLVPDVTAFDAEGNAFPFQEKMKGNYSVVVFGCLT